MFFIRSGKKRLIEVEAVREAIFKTEEFKLGFDSESEPSIYLLIKEKPHSSERTVMCLGNKMR